MWLVSGRWLMAHVSTKLQQVKSSETQRSLEE